MSAVKDMYLKVFANIYLVIFLNIQSILIRITPEYYLIAELKQCYIHIVVN